MAELWQDPYWASQTRAKILATIQAKPLKETKRHPKRSFHIRYTLYLEPDLHKRLQEHAHAQKQSINETIRTYIQWGLDLEQGEEKDV